MKRKNTKGVFINTLKPKICSFCKKKFQPNGSHRKFCSKECYYQSKVGQPSKKRNGKNINCKECDKEFYIPRSRIGKKKFCSSKCAFVDQAKQVKKKRCKICSKEFLVYGLSRYKTQTCSDECHYELARRISKKSYLRRYKIKDKKDWKSLKDGSQVARGKHGRACADYRKKLLEKHDHLTCEICGCNSNGTPRFETHHIYFASRFPKHKELHNPLNLINVCTTCHSKFHKGELKDKFNKLEQSRGLKELFNT